MKKTLYTIALILPLFIATHVDAANHKYVCADWSTLTNASCSSDIVTVQSIPSGVAKTDGTFPLLDGTTYYVQYDANISAGDEFWFCYSNGTESVCPADTVTSSGTAVQFTAAANGTSGDEFLQIYSITGALPADFSNVCISDVSYADASYACGGSPPPPANPPIQIAFDVGTTTCTFINASTTECVSVGGTRTVDNPTQDLMNMFLLFFLSAGFIIFIFKKR